VLPCSQLGLLSSASGNVKYVNTILGITCLYKDRMVTGEEGGVGCNGGGVGGGGGG
jgi:hypothetical protein